MELMVVELGTREKDYGVSTAAMNVTVQNKLFTKRVSHLVTYESGLSKSQADCLVQRNQRKSLKDIIKVLPSEECLTQH